MPRLVRIWMKAFLSIHKIALQTLNYMRKNVTSASSQQIIIGCWQKQVEINGHRHHYSQILLLDLTTSRKYQLEVQNVKIQI